jgi:hypothetical protein
MRASKLGKPGHRHSDAEREALRVRNTGKKLSETTRAKIGAAGRGRTGYWAGRKRGPLSQEWRDKIGKANTGKTRSAEARAKVGRANKGHPATHNGRQYPYRGIAFRSTWEVRAAKAMDTLGMKWDYEPTRFDLGSCTYCPDFYLPETGVYLEVKGWYGPVSQKKTQLFRELYPDVPLLLAKAPVLKALELAASKAA